MSAEDMDMDLDELRKQNIHIFSPFEVDPVRGELMSKREAAEKGQISPETIDAYIEKGYLKEVRGPGNNIYVHYRDLLRASWKSYSEGKTKKMPGK